MIGARLLDRYQVTAELGRGGMGVVYRAQDPLLRREVAIKMITPSAITDDAERRFRREAQVVAQLDHPAITPIFDFGVHEGSLFLVMPVVEGTTLMSLVKRRALTLGDTLEIVAQVAEALDYSHSRRVLHRDIKPENIMVQKRDGLPLQVRVMDFGLALVSQPDADRLTQTGHFFGTLTYFSPERASSSGHEDERSDIYALATVLYECLAGEPPFTGTSAGLLYRIVNEHPQPLRERAVDIDSDLEWVVLGCLAKDPASRLQRAGELAAALRRYLSGLDQVDQSRTILMPAVPPSLRPSQSSGPRLVGREGETVELQARLNAALRGNCQFVLIGGEPGIGKTRMLDELTQLSRAREIRVLHGRFSDHESTLPYQGFCELVHDYFRQHVASRPSRQRPELSDLAGDLQRYFPSLAEIDELRESDSSQPMRTIGPTPPAGEEKLVLYELLARTLTRLAAGKPLVIVLESLHCARASLDALQYIVRRLGPTPTLIAGTYRSTDVNRQHALYRLLASFEGDPSFLNLTLPRLPKRDHRKLVVSLLGGQPVSDELADKLHEASDGNPLFTQELVRSAVDGGSVAQDGSGIWILSTDVNVAGDPLPRTIRQVVEERLERLSEVPRRLLSIASVIGRTFAFEDLVSLAEGELDADEVDDGVEGLITDRLLVEDSRSRDDALVFSSAVVRDVLYAALPRRRRRRYHRRHAEQLERRHAQRRSRVYPQLMHHFAEGDVADKALAYGRALAEVSLDAFLADEAVSAARCALSFVEDVDVPDQPGGRPALEGALRLLLARSLRAAGQLEGALKQAGEALRLLERAGSGEQAPEAALQAAEIAWQARRVAATQRLVDRGCELARRVENRPALARLLTLGATVDNLNGRYQKARSQLDEAAALTASEVTEEEPAVAEGGTLVTVLPTPVTRLVPGAHELIEDIEVMTNVFDNLVASDDEGNLVPALARAWHPSEDDRAFEVDLRTDVRFSDGRPLTAELVKWSLEGAARRNRDTTLEVIAYEVLVGMADFLDGAAEHVAGIEVTGEHALTFRLLEPLPLFPALLADPGCAIARETEEGFLGTGPFRLTSVDDERVLLTRNDEDWRPRPAVLDRIEMRIGLDAAGIAAGLHRGEIDLGRDLLPEDLDPIQRDPRFRRGLVESTKRNVYFMLLNRVGPATREPALRQALSSVLRVHDLVWRTLGRFAQPAVCLLPPGILGHDPGRRRETLGREQAAALLDQAGIERPLVLRAALHPSLRDRYGALTRAIFDEWAALGVQVEVISGDIEDYLPYAYDSAGVDVLIGRWFADYPDADTFTYSLLHSRAGHYPGYVGLSEVDRLFERARSERRADVRRSLYWQAEQCIAREHALLPLFHDIDYRVAGPTVRRLRMTPVAPFVRYDEVAHAAPDEGSSPGPDDALGFRESGTVRTALSDAVPSLDPALAVMAAAAEIVPNVFETLTRIEEGARVVPFLASSFGVEDGGRRLRIRLRQAVRFHDGRRLTVRDVRASFERLLRSPHAGAEAPLLPIRGARALRDGASDELSGLHIVSPFELVLELDQPLPFFPAMLAHPSTAIVPEGTVRFTGNWREGCAGTGPFRLVRLHPRERVELEANPGYRRRGVPRCDRLIFDLAVPAARVVGDLRAGRLSLAAHLPPRDVETLRRDPSFAGGYHEAPGLGTYFMVCHRRREALADAERRWALAHVLAGDRAVQAAGRLAIPAHGLIPPGLLGHETNRRLLVPPESAPTLLEGLELSVAVHPVFLDRYDEVWRVLRRSLVSAGVRLDEHHPEAKDMFRFEAGSTFDLVLTRWLADFPDPDAFAGLLDQRDGIVGALCGTDELDTLVARGRCESDPSLRQAIYRELEQRITREGLVIPLFYEQVCRIARPELRGLRLSGMRLPEVAYEELSQRL